MSAPSSQTSQTPYLIRTSVQSSDTALTPRVHPINNSACREQLSLGDKVGLTKTGIHLCRLPPHTESTVLHWHNNDDEWIYVLKAGTGAVLRIREGEAETREETVREGDFYGFAGGVRNAHALKTGDAELVYLLGGSRERLDVSFYPEIGKRRVNDRTGNTESWTVEEGMAQAL